MGIKSFLKPTKGRVAFLIAMLIISFLLSIEFNSGYMCLDKFGVCSQLPEWLSVTFIFLVLPFYVLNSLGLPALVLLAVYWYLLACIYVSAFNKLDGGLDRRYPWINARWKKK